MSFGDVKIYNTNTWEVSQYSVNSHGGNVIISNKRFGKTPEERATLKAGTQRANISNEQTLYSTNFTNEDYTFEPSRYILTHLPSTARYNSCIDYLSGTHWTDFVDESLLEDGHKFNGNENLSLGQKGCQIFEQIVGYAEKITKKATNNVVLAMNDLSNLYAKFKAGNTGIDGITNIRCDGNAGVYTVTYLDENNKEQVLAFDFMTAAEIQAHKKPEVQEYEAIADNGIEYADEIRTSLADTYDEK